MTVGRRSIKANRQRNLEILCLEVDGVSGTAVITTGGSEATLTDNGTGDYTLTFKKPKKRFVSAIACSKTAALYAAVTAGSRTAVTVKTYNAAGSAADAVFFVHVVISNSDAQ